MDPKLVELYNCSNENPILAFDGAFRYLSNFQPCEVVYDGLSYTSSEHAYMAQKTLDLGLREKIRLQLTPGKAKKLGRSIKLRSDWEEVKIQIMYEIVLVKFSNNLDLKALLLATGDRYLEEGNYWKDTFWGVCNGVGLNCLGQILMLVRSQLRL